MKQTTTISLTIDIQIPYTIEPVSPDLGQQMLCKAIDKLLERYSEATYSTEVRISTEYFPRGVRN